MSIIYKTLDMSNVKGNTVRITRPNPELHLPDFKELAKKVLEKKIQTQVCYIDYLEECKERGQKPISRSSFFMKLRNARESLRGPKVYMRQDREYGEELGFDFAGDKLTLRHNDGTSHTYCVCVMSWSASSLTYAELTPDQTTASICKAIGNALRFFKCRPYYLIIDNAKSMVIRHQKGREALLNNSFEHFMQSIGIEVRVATPRSPTQKSVVERAVYFTQERCLKRIDTTVPMNLEECNAKLLQLVEKYINNEKYKNSKLRTRRVLFDEHEFSKAQKALAEIPVYYEHIPLLKVGKDYSVTIKGIRRLVPYQLAGSEVSANIRGSVVELLQKGEIVAKFSLTEEPTVEEDMSKMPEAHHSVKEKRFKYPDADSIYEVSKM